MPEAKHLTINGISKVQEDIKGVVLQIFGLDEKTKNNQHYYTYAVGDLGATLAMGTPSRSRSSWLRTSPAAESSRSSW